MRCSDLGRTAFRDAESKMNKLSMVIGYIVEPGGTVRVFIVQPSPRYSELTCIGRQNPQCSEEREACEASTAPAPRPVGNVF